MPSKITVQITGARELQRRLKQMNPQQNVNILRRSLEEAAFAIQKDAATVQIVHGRGDAPPLVSRLSNRSGGRGLVGSIKVDKRPLPNAIEIGSELRYAAAHEHGIPPMPRRPFMQPALDKIRNKFVAIVVKHWKREARL